MKVKMKAVSKVTGFSGAAACARSSMTVKYWVIVPTEHVRLSLSSDVLVLLVRLHLPNLTGNCMVLHTTTL